MEKRDSKGKGVALRLTAQPSVVSNQTAVVVPPRLAPGFRFHPNDEELVVYYLRRKVTRQKVIFEAITEIDICKYEPWELHDYCTVNTVDQEYYFFSAIDKKYSSGSRLNRATTKGHWKATGKDRFIRHKSLIVGTKKTLVYHAGRAPNDRRTNWVMHEYRLVDEELNKVGAIEKDVFMLCKIFLKSEIGAPISANRYRPFNEEEWDDNADVEDAAAHGDEIAELDQNAVAVEAFQCTVMHGGIRNCRERGNDDEAIYLGKSKKAKLDDPISGNRNGSEASQSITNQDPLPTKVLLNLCWNDPVENNSPTAKVGGIGNIYNGQRVENDETLSLSIGKRLMLGSSSTATKDLTGLSLSFSDFFSKDPIQDENPKLPDPISGNKSGLANSSMFSPPLLDFFSKDNPVQPESVYSLNSSALEMSLPSGYQKLIAKLEKEVLKGSVERENLNTAISESHAIIADLQAINSQLVKENEGLRKLLKDSQELSSNP